MNVDPEQIDIAPAVPPSAGRKTIFGTGEMADLTRAYDWSQTPVGPVEQWPSPELSCSAWM